MPRATHSSARDLIELIAGFGFILLILGVPTPLQRVLSPIALVGPLAVVLLGRSSRDPGEDGQESRTSADVHPGADELGLGARGLVTSPSVLPAAGAMTLGR